MERPNRTHAQTRCLDTQRPPNLSDAITNMGRTRSSRGQALSRACCRRSICGLVGCMVSVPSRVAVGAGALPAQHHHVMA